MIFQVLLSPLRQKLILYWPVKLCIRQTRFCGKTPYSFGKRCRELIDLAKKKNLVLMVGHLLQYHRCFYQIETTGPAANWAGSIIFILID